MESTIVKNSHNSQHHSSGKQHQLPNGKNSENNPEFVRKLTELLEWQKEQEEQVKLAEQFTLKLRKELEKADIKEYRSVDELVTTDNYSNDETDVLNELDKSREHQTNKGKIYLLLQSLSYCLLYSTIIRMHLT